MVQIPEWLTVSSLKTHVNDAKENDPLGRENRCDRMPLNDINTTIVMVSKKSSPYGKTGFKFLQLF
jgi:hypothetical protein